MYNFLVVIMLCYSARYIMNHDSSCLRRKKIDFGQNFFFNLFFLATKGNLHRGVRKSWSQVPEMTSSRDIKDFRLKIVKK